MEPLLEPEPVPTRPHSAYLSTPQMSLKVSTASTNSLRKTRAAMPVVPYFRMASNTFTDTCTSYNIMHRRNKGQAKSSGQLPHVQGALLVWDIVFGIDTHMEQRNGVSCRVHHWFLSTTLRRGVAKGHERNTSLVYLDCRAEGYIFTNIDCAIHNTPRLVELGILLTVSKTNGRMSTPSESGHVMRSAQQRTLISQ